jgi:hypothetical protein
MRYIEKKEGAVTLESDVQRGLYEIEASRTTGRWTVDMIITKGDDSLGVWLDPEEARELANALNWIADYADVQAKRD